MNQVNRPTAAEWHEHLSRILIQDGLQRCTLFPRDYRHIKFAGMPCPQCARVARANVLTKQPRIDATLNPSNPVRPSPPAASVWLGGPEFFLYMALAIFIIYLIISKVQDDSGPPKKSTIVSTESISNPRSSGSQNSLSAYNFSKTAPAAAPSNGLDKYVFSNGDRYQGNFLDGRPHGSGVMNYADGKKYIGNWKRGLRDGLGWLYAADGATIYYGHWKGDEPSAMSIPRTAVPAEPLAKPSERTSPSPKTATEDVKPRYDELTARVQRELTRLGFKPGPVDGYYGSRTRDAILSFQGANGLTRDGEISNYLIEKLANTPTLPTQKLNSKEQIGHVAVVHAQENYFEIELRGVPDVRAGDLLLIESANVTARLEKIVGMKASAVVLRGNIRLIRSNATITKIN